MTGEDEAASGAAEIGEDEAASDAAEIGEDATSGREIDADTRDALAAELGEHVDLLLCLDFDGTLAEIVDEPDAAALREENHELLRALRDDPRVAVAIVSGRDLRDVRSRVGVDGIVYAGNHGMELARGDDDPAVHPTVERYADVIGGVSERLSDHFEDEEGVEVEHKGETATVHYRHAPDERTGEIEEGVRTVVEAAEGDITVTGGKQILELRPPVDWDKGRVVELLDSGCGDACLTVYVGDDVTDEAAFRAIQPEGVGVVVGDRESDARLRIDEPTDVTALLEWLVADGLDALRDEDETEDDPDRRGPMAEMPDWKE